MKRILINATHAEEIRVALCKDNHVYDFDLENRTREQKKANIYKGHVTRVEPSLEAVFVEYGSERQGFLSIREISREYLTGDPRNCKNIKEVISEGTELLVQVEKEERGNKGAALSTFISLAGRYLVLMPNNSSGGGISRQISGSTRDEMKRMLSKLKLPKGMSVIIRTAGIGRTQEDLQNDLNHLLDIWQNINHTAKNTPSPCLAHREAGVVTRAVRDYLRDDIAEVWIDNEQAYNEAYHFVSAVMPHQVNKLRKYLEIEPMFSNFGIEAQIESAYQREVKLPSGGSIVIDQTEALVSIDINSAKSTRGGDVESTAHHTNLEAADEIARQLRLRDMGGLIVIDFIDMLEEQHRKSVENRIKDATQNDRARIQFASISRFGLLEMSRQRLRPSLEEATGYTCPRCHGTGVIRDIRSLSLSIMRQIEKVALKEAHGEVQVEVPIEIGAFLLNEKRDSLVYLEQDSGARITILPHAHLETPHFNINYNQTGHAPASYERVTQTQSEHTKALGYETNWHTEQPVNQQQARKNRGKAQNRAKDKTQKHGHKHVGQQQPTHNTNTQVVNQNKPTNDPQKPEVCAWLSNLFTTPQQAMTKEALQSADAAAAIESHINSGATSRGVEGSIDVPARQNNRHKNNRNQNNQNRSQNNNNKRTRDDKRGDNKNKKDRYQDKNDNKNNSSDLPRRESNSRRPSRGERDRNKQHDTVTTNSPVNSSDSHVENPTASQKNRDNRRGDKRQDKNGRNKSQAVNPNQVMVSIDKTQKSHEPAEFVNIDIATGDVATTSVNPVKSQITSAPANTSQRNVKASKPSSTETSKKQPTSKAKTEQNTINIVKEAVPPHLLGRAKNDPRDIKPRAKIKGTMLDFIHESFGVNAGQVIAEDGLVSAFITAVNTLVPTKLAHKPLTESYISSYKAGITAVDRTTVDAGTSSKTAPAPTFRATNDIRGQIAGYEQVPEHLQVTNKFETTKLSNSPEQTDAEPENLTSTDEANNPSTTDLLAIKHEATENLPPETEKANVKPLTTSGDNATLAQNATVENKHSDSTEQQPTINLAGLTAGEFITQQLGVDTAKTLIESDSFASAFIKALAIDNSVASPEVIQTNIAPSEESKPLTNEATTDEENLEQPVKKTRKTPTKRMRNKAEDNTETADTTEEKPAKKKRAPTTRKRRTSKKASADKVEIVKKPTTDTTVDTVEDSTSVTPIDNQQSLNLAEVTENDNSTGNAE